MRRTRVRSIQLILIVVSRRIGPGLGEAGRKRRDLSLFRIIEAPCVGLSRAWAQCIGHGLVRVSVGALRLHITGAAFAMGSRPICPTDALRLTVSFSIRLQSLSEGMGGLEVGLRTGTSSVQRHLMWV